MRPILHALLPIVAATLAACATGRDDAPDSNASPVVAILDEVRPFAPRLGAASRYLACRPVVGSNAMFDFGCAESPLPATLLDRALRLAETIGSGEPAGSRASRWGTAILDLALAGGNETVLDQVVLRLEGLVEEGEAGGDRPNDEDALILNDLAVALLARATARHSAEDVFRALDLLERATRAERVPPVVHYNRGLMLERVGLLREAREAWSAVTEGEPVAEWKREAAERLAVIDASAFRRSLSAVDSARVTLGGGRAGQAHDPQQLRERFLDSILPALGQALTWNDSRSRDSLERDARAIAGAIMSASGDSTVHLAVEEVVGMSERTPRAAGAALSAAAAGAALFESGRYTSAVEALDSAVRGLHTAAPMLAAWSEALLSGSDLVEGRSAAAEERWRRITRVAEGRGAWALAARAWWGLGLLLSRQQELREAERAYRKADFLFARSRERANRGRVLTQFASVQARLGRDAEGLQAMFEGLHLLRDGASGRARHDAMVAAGLLLQEVELPHAAVVVFREALGGSGSTGRAQDGVDAALYLAMALSAAGEQDSAQMAMRWAESQADSMPAGTDTARARADIARVAASLARPQDAPHARALLDGAASYFASKGNVYVRREVMLQRTRLALLVKDSGDAIAHLTTLALQLAPDPGRTTNEDDRRRQVSIRRSLLTELLSLRLARGDTLRALETFALLAGGTSADAARFLRDAVPSGVTMLAYAVLPEEVIVWSKRGSRLLLRRHSASSQHVQALVDRFVRTLRTPGADPLADASARALGSLLLDDVTPHAEAGDELVIVADGPLLQLPFAALPVDQGFLVARHPIAYAASLAPRSLSGTERRADQGPGGGGRVVVVGRPLHDKQLFAALPDLPASEREAREVAGQYVEPTVAVHEKATRAWLLEQLPGADLLHFAGHAQISPSAASRSHLVLAKAGESVTDNALFATEIRELTLSRMTLAVLSSCGTTTQMSRRATASQSLARAFLDAGVAAVVSSLWEADDVATTTLMVAFHRARRVTTSASGALRTAQLASIAAERAGEGGATRQWAAFRIDLR